MNTTPNDPLAMAFQQAMRTHLFYQAARDLLASDLPAAAELLGVPHQLAAGAAEPLDPLDEADLLVQVGRSLLIHLQFMHGDPYATLGTLLVVHGKALLENRSSRLEQYVAVLDHRVLPDALSLEHAGLDVTLVPVFDIPFERLLSRPAWAPFAVLPRPHGPDRNTAMGLAEQAIRGAQRPDEERLLAAADALNELP